MTYALVQSTAPTLEPVTLDEARAQVRISDDIHDEDTLLNTLIQVAREHVESATNRQLLTATYTWKLNAFPAYPSVIRLPRPPLISVTSVQYVDTDGDTQTMDSGDYDVDTSSEPGEIHLGYGESWPTPRSHHHAVIVTYTAGYGATRISVPAAIKQAMLLLIGHWYANREAVITGMVSKEVAITVDRLLSPYRVSELVTC